METPDTRPPKGYAWGAVTIQAWALVGDARVVTPTSVPALIHECGYLCLHKPIVEGFGLWTISHLPSGMKIATLPTQALARGCITSLLALPGLASTGLDPSVLSLAMAVVSSLLSSLTPRTTPTRPRRPASAPQDAPSSFSPVFRGYVPTPADRAAQNKAALAFGGMWNQQAPTTPTSIGSTREWRVLEEAAAIHGREEMVTRLVQSPHNLILEGDIPERPEKIDLTVLSPRPGQRYTLRDGTPATPGEFRRRYETLMGLGDRLRSGSLIFLRAYAEGENQGWDTARLDRWEAIDQRFVSIIQEGWMEWSAAAYCFWAAPPEFQRNVVAKLGYIGSAERGWHDLAVKTLLRHPEVKDCQPLRREIREKIAGRL